MRNYPSFFLNFMLLNSKLHLKVMSNYLSNSKVIFSMKGSTTHNFRFPMTVGKSL